MPPESIGLSGERMRNRLLTSTILLVRLCSTATTILKHGGLGVAHLLTDIAKVSDPVTLAGAYLHDTVEDTDTTFAELEEEFGMEVSELVRECTDDKSLPKEQRKQLQIDNAPKHSHKVQATSKRLLNYTTTKFRLA